MNVTRFKSDKEVLIRPRKYLIDWDNDGDSKLEVRFRDLIYPYWKNSIILFQFRIPGSKYRLDFLNCNKRLCVEIDGSQHNQFNKFFHGNSRITYLASINRDMDKDDWLRKNNIAVIHLDDKDLNNFSPKYIEDKFDMPII